MLEYDVNLISIEDSKILFEEIMSDFYEKKYRSCICNINSLLYLDLIKKLNELKNNLNDSKSAEILEVLEKMDDSDEKYSACEIKLLDLCRDKKFITKQFHEDAMNLRKIRNRCAHPAFSGEGLFTPNRLEVAMYIEKIFKNVLAMNYINFYNITDYILEDIKDAYDKGISPDNKSLVNRVKRLFEKCDNKNMQKVFDSLFDLCIIKNDDDCKKYRDYTYMYMKVLIEISKKKDYIISKEHVKKINITHLDEQYFTKNPYVSKICGDGIIAIRDISDYNPEILDLYKDFIINSPEINNIYNQLFDNLKTYVEYAISEDNRWVLSKNILEYIEEAHTKKHFYKLLKKVILETPTFDSFDLGDFCLEEYCEHFDLLTEEQRKELLLLMNKNSQIISIKKNHYEEYKRKILSLFKTYDYDRFIKALQNDEPYEILPF